ncbi:MAG: NUDIX domain-containing protein [Candidatus Nanoarchaeia archaeon]|nr:NUDIX domain-containing protein [Candidatus Nanoarchaeia archaeon]
MPNERSAGAIIYNKGLYLILYRKAHDHYREGWFFARGKIEEGEDIEATARREIFEETGINDLFFVKGFKETVTWFYRKEGQLIHKTAVYIFAETSTENVIISKEHDGYEWLSFEQAYARLSFPSDRKVLKKAHDFIEKMKIV